ncbi:MAG: hypothetical protein DWQ10_06345, partial [Calditrichaeota bacterium]
MIIMLLMYQVLAGTPVPEQKILKKKIQEDVMIVDTDVIKKFLPEKVEIKPQKKEPPKPRYKKPEVVRQKKVDLSEYENQFSGRSQPKLNKKSQPQTFPWQTKAPPALEVGSSNEGVVFQQVTARTNAPSRIIVPKSNPGVPGKRDREDLDIDRSSSLGVQSTGPITSVPSINVPNRVDVKPDVIVTEPPESPEIEITPQIKEIAPIYPELIAWLKKNPVDFSTTVRKFMGASDEHLTSHVQFRAEGRKFDIFIACHEQQFEIRICLVEGQQTTLLIDKDFKKQSNFFRIGTIHRGEDNRIF